MPLALSEAIQRLLSGYPLPWAKFSDNKAGAVQLKSPGARRLLHYFLACNQTQLSDAHESLFDGLISAWENTDFDPAATDLPSSNSFHTGPWRLVRLEASGFGGLNFADGPPFIVEFNGENWCLEGQNGSGKTSLASAIIWALTGYRCRDQEGLVLEQGVRTPVYSDTGVQIGDWPSIAAYPATITKLASTAEAWVRLTFRDPSGNRAEAYRRLVAAPGVAPIIEVKTAPGLLSAPQLLEIGLLMPARLARIGFGDKSQTIYDAVKLLTGLDQLAAVAEGATNFSHKSKRFLKYAIDNGAQALEAQINLLVSRATEEASKADFHIAIKSKREDHGYAQELREISQQAADRAAGHLNMLIAEIAATVDTKDAADRIKIKNAVGSARAIFQASERGLPVFGAWAALSEAYDDARFLTLSTALATARRQLAEATAWDKRQSEDRKLRLKALASRFFEPSFDSYDDPDCPLCEGKLSGDKRRALAAELKELKLASTAAERKLADVCLELEKLLRDNLTPSLNANFDLLSGMKPSEAFLDAAKERFVDTPPFSTVLTGMGSFASEESARIARDLPVFTYATIPSESEELTSTQELDRFISKVERIEALIGWWNIHSNKYTSGWISLRGVAQEDRDSPADSLERKLAELEEALEKVKPLDDLEKALSEAATQAAKWLPIYLRQSTRETIAEALQPLKELRFLVANETSNSISSLSGRMRAVLERIHFRDRLSFKDAGFNKKTVAVAASFDPGIRIDASIVANSSWLRAILWAFVLALREEAIESSGENPFPLMLLDDPQVTFDPRNKRKWAEEIARLGNDKPTSVLGAQIIIITHERQFFQMLVNLEKLEGQQGLVVRLCDTSKVAAIIHGDSLARAFEEAIATNNDEAGHSYVLKVRTYCEDLLKIMFRAEGPDVCDLALDRLVQILRTRHEGSVPPFTNPAFKQLLGVVGGGGGGKPLHYINEAHHKFDGTIGVAQAEDVKKFWVSKLQFQLHSCFKIFAEFEAYAGEPRLFGWMDHSVELPPGNSADLRQFFFQHTGVIAAARTDGRAGDGLITVDELSEAQAVKLHNHDAYHLAAGTLDPVADVGDVIIVSNYAKVEARSLIVATYEHQLLARRYNETDIHPHIAVLTGQATDPTAIAQPVVVARERITMRKIVGTIFAKATLPIPPKDANAEFIALPNLSVVQMMLQDAKLLQVRGRSAEPIALDGQFVITQPISHKGPATSQMEGRLVIAVDENGVRYLKRFRSKGAIVVLESVNPDGSAPAELLSIDGEQGFPKLIGLLEVVGVLFDLP